MPRADQVDGCQRRTGTEHSSGSPRAQRRTQVRLDGHILPPVLMMSSSLHSRQRYSSSLARFAGGVTGVPLEVDIS